MPLRRGMVYKIRADLLSYIRTGERPFAPTKRRLGGWWWRITMPGRCFSMIDLSATLEMTEREWRPLQMRDADTGGTMTVIVLLWVKFIHPEYSVLFKRKREGESPTRPYGRKIVLLKWKFTTADILPRLRRGSISAVV